MMSVQHFFYSTPCTVAWRCDNDTQKKKKNVAHLVLTTKACLQVDEFTQLISTDTIMAENRLRKHREERKRQNVVFHCLEFPFRALD